MSWYWKVHSHCPETVQYRKTLLNRIHIVLPKRIRISEFVQCSTCGVIANFSSQQFFTKLYGKQFIGGLAVCIISHAVYICTLTASICLHCPGYEFLISCESAIVQVSKREISRCFQVLQCPPISRLRATKVFLETTKSVISATNSPSATLAAGELSNTNVISCHVMWITCLLASSF